MSNESYKHIIEKLISSSEDRDYLIAVYTFAKHYPDKSKDGNNTE